MLVKNKMPIYDRGKFTVIERPQSFYSNLFIFRDFISYYRRYDDSAVAIRVDIEDINFHRDFNRAIVFNATCVRIVTPN